MNWDWEGFTKTFGYQIGIEGPIVNVKSLHGGCINQAFAFSSKTNNQKYFIKINSSNLLWMFQAEYDALSQIKSTIDHSDIIVCPKPILTGTYKEHSFLLLDCLNLLNTSKSSSDWNALGRGLASLHSCRKDIFGWHRKSTIGSTPQPNNQCDNWIEFWTEHRLLHQVKLAYDSGFSINGFDRIISKIGELFKNYDPYPSLIHGDLWSGNVGFEAGGKPAIFDPASYCADREAEFGIIHMFGGFPDEFFNGYDSILKRSDDFFRRKYLYQVYHELNHLNLFGGSYLPSVLSSVKKILTEIA